jgi:hypothetical protein
MNARLIFAFSDGEPSELWGLPGLASWAISIGACVAIEVKK